MSTRLIYGRVINLFIINMEKTVTYFSRGWAFDNTVEFVQFYGSKCVCKFIVKLKPGFMWAQYSL